jgi:hypothetical protein
LARSSAIWTDALVLKGAPTLAFRVMLGAIPSTKMPTRACKIVSKWAALKRTDNQTGSWQNSDSATAKSIGYHHLVFCGCWSWLNYEGFDDHKFDNSRAARFRKPIYVIN